jgi:two-component system sensor histidine kinase YesM
MVRKAWDKLRNAFASHIQVRLTMFFLSILLPLVAVSLFANVKSAAILEWQTGERTTNSMQSVLDNIDSVLNDIEHLSLLISTDFSVKPILLDAGGILLTSDLYGFYTVMERMENIVDIHGALKEISILHTASGTMLSTQYGAKKLDYANEPWFQAALKANGNTIFYVSGEEDRLFGADTVHFVRLMELPDLENTPNVLVLSVDKTMLLERIRGVQPSPRSSIYLYSDQGELVAGAGPDRALSYEQWNVMRDGGVHPEDSELLVWKTQSDRTGWSLVMVQPKEELYKETSQLSLFTMLIIAISIVLAVIISFGVYKWISAPLKELLYGMKQMRMGILSTRLPGGRKDELGALMEAFNLMIAEQQRLIRDVYEHQLQLSKSELKILHSQINPHFLYNTLDSIYWTAKNYDAEEISEMVLNLSKFFRLSLSKGREIFTVAETLEHLQYYLKVQQFRYMNQFTVRFDVAEDAGQVCVLKLLLQPIVENAILHGLEKRGEGAELVISGRLQDGVLVLEVADNGAGIPPERLALIRRELELIEQNERITALFEDPSKELFGLRNVAARLKLYYGPQAKLRMDSRVGEGTTVRLYIPLERTEMLTPPGAADRKHPA